MTSTDSQLRGEHVLFVPFSNRGLIVHMSVFLASICANVLQVTAGAYHVSVVYTSCKSY